MSDVMESHVVARVQPWQELTGVDIGALILRVGIGIVYLGHGLQKFGWFDSGGYPDSISEQEEFLRFFGYSSVGFLAWVITLTELVAGLSLVLGAITPLGAAAAAGIAFQFIAGPQWDAGLFGNESGSGFEYSWAFFVAAVAIGFIGPGRLSADQVLGYRRVLDRSARHPALGERTGRIRPLRSPRDRGYRSGPERAEAPAGPC